MMMFMPIMFLFFFLWAPSGLVLYWLVSNLLGIGQQYCYQPDHRRAGRDGAAAAGGAADQAGRRGRRPTARAATDDTDP